MPKTLDEVALIERIVRAKVHLEGAKASHTPGCATDDDTSHAPCNCGATSSNAKIGAALRELKLS
jgi:hypothetical protein